MKKQLALFSGKMGVSLGNIFGKNGSSFPGLVANKIDSNILNHFSNAAKHFIFITGTNGKTTTTHLLSHIFRMGGYRVITNAQGANMITGITSTFLKNANKFFDFAILEIDEASLPKIIKQIQPEKIVVTNFFRDQLDRYGEIDQLIDSIIASIQTLTNTELILNTDDPNVMRLSKYAPSIFFGLEKSAFPFDPFDIQESLFCPFCQQELIYSHIHFGQLGHFSCSCGFSRMSPHYPALQLDVSEGISITTPAGKVSLPLDGVYNAYNCLAALACSMEYGLTMEQAKNALLTFQMENGRMERFKGEHAEFILNLVKNPMGLNVSFSSFIKQQQFHQIALFLNDNAADGRDISWIWDADFEMLLSRKIHFFCGGTRSQEIALRLKYMDIPNEHIFVSDDLSVLISRIAQSKNHTFFLPSYTMLQPVRKEILKWI